MSDAPDGHRSRQSSLGIWGGWRSRFWVTAACIVLTVVAADRAAVWLAPPRDLREVEDAVQDLRTGDPTVLVIGSSHGRTFAVMDDSLRQRTGDQERILAVPVEWGKLSSYQWVLENRLLPLFDERSADGTLARTALHRAILVTEWWDSCAGEDRPMNLPARGWSWGHYVADVRANGLTTYNGNFLGYRWSRLWRGSGLVQDRGHGRLLSSLRQRLLPASSEALRAHFDVLAAEWQRMVEAGDTCIGAEREMRALDGMLDTLAARGIEVTVLLYPRMPVTLTSMAQTTTLPRFAAMIRARTAARGMRLVDLTSTSPLTDADFGGDFDHVLPEGNARFSGWALNGPLSFLGVPRP